MDTQGHELHALRGATELLNGGTRIDLVEIEFAPEMMPGGAADAVAVLELLRRGGFLCFQWSVLGKGVAARARGRDTGEQFDGFVARHIGGSAQHYPASELVCVRPRRDAAALEAQLAWLLAALDCHGASASDVAQRVRVELGWW